MKYLDQIALKLCPIVQLAYDSSSTESTKPCSISSSIESSKPNPPVIPFSAAEICKPSLLLRKPSPTGDFDFEQTKPIASFASGGGGVGGIGGGGSGGKGGGGGDGALEEKASSVVDGFESSSDVIILDVRVIGGGRGR